MLHTHLHRHGAPTRGTNGRTLGTFQKALLCRKFGSIAYKSPFSLFFVFKARHCFLRTPRFVRPLPVSDYVKDRSCFQWKWREFLEKVWPWAGGIMLLCAMRSAEAALSVIASLKDTQKRTWFVGLSSLPIVVFGVMCPSVYNCYSAAGDHTVTSGNTGRFFYVYGGAWRELFVWFC